jgi:hypothetical protein
MKRSLAVWMSLLAACNADVAQDPAATPQDAADAHSPFAFSKPVAVVALPNALREISGMVALDDARIACVQDEKGLLYEVALKDGTILSTARFGPDGDYEGVARTSDRWFFARSDGVLLEVGIDKDGKLLAPEEIALALPQRDLEALAFDPPVEGRAARLLLAGKEPPEGDKQERDQRFVLALDPTKRALDEQPAWSLSRKAIRAHAAELRSAGRDDGEQTPKPKLAMHISEIAVQPATGTLWILSGPDRALLAVDRAGSLLAIQVFDEGLLPQPEALAFLPCGDLVVASEGKDGPARLVRFALRR